VSGNAAHQQCRGGDRPWRRSLAAADIGSQLVRITCRPAQSGVTETRTCDRADYRKVLIGPAPAIGGVGEPPATRVQASATAASEMSLTLRPLGAPPSVTRTDRLETWPRVSRSSIALIVEIRRPAFAA
jgi:hypothetical protein